MGKNWLLFKVFFMAGALTFSGGMAMLPVIRRELVTKHGFISEGDLLEYATIAQGLPGVIALSTACFVGKKCNGWPGQLAASFGVFLPAYTLMTLGTIFYQFIPQEGPLLAAFVGIRATACVFVFEAGWNLVKHNLSSRLRVGVAVFSLVMTGLLGLSPLLVLGGLVACSCFFSKGQVAL